MHAPSGLGLVSSVCLLPAKDKASGDHPFTVFSLITSACMESMIVTDLKSSTPCHSVSIAFENCCLLFGRRVFPGYLVGVPSTEMKFSVHCARLGRRNRKGSVFLASSEVEVSSLLSCLLDVHRSFTFSRHQSSVSVTLHRHFVVSRGSFLGHAQVESLYNWVITFSGCAHLLYLGRACFGRMKGDNGFTCLSSSRPFPMRFLRQFSIRGYVQMMSQGISLFSKSNCAITDSNLHVRAG